MTPRDLWRGGEKRLDRAQRFAQSTSRDVAIAVGSRSLLGQWFWLPDMGNL